MITIQRDRYLKRLISRRHNGRIKIITGVRRCGKSYLLFEIFSNWLKEQGTSDEHIIKIDLEDRRNKALRDPDALLSHIDSLIKDKEMYYVMIDEIQHVDEFEDVLNSYLKIPNVEVFVTGSNAKFLSKDVVTTFRGRGDVVHITPLLFSEYYSVMSISEEKAFDEYLLYGGLPQTVFMESEEEKITFLKDIYTETYLRDIKERYSIVHEAELEMLLDILSSSVGSLTNPQKLENVFRTEMKSTLTAVTIKKYLEYICDSFLMAKADRFDVRGKKKIGTPYKFYFSDPGLRNARLNFRQKDLGHVMENIVYNELCTRGYNVDVGVVPVVIREEGKQVRRQYEVDFVCNLGSKRYYIQAAWRMDSEAKIAQEEKSLRTIDDSFKKILVVGYNTPIIRDESGITTMSIYDFLLKEDSMDL
ncbi:MAG: ATP-binding protein [Muribaculaceae bacterium]|nr:ATP-binding protein [Muribaculaceae bacterium]